MYTHTLVLSSWYVGCVCVGGGGGAWLYFISHPQKLPSFIKYVPEDKHLLVAIKPAMLGHPSYQLHGDKE